MNQSITAHPLGIRAKVLLSSVFGPFAQDDQYGSRAINPMELYQNQVTRVQGGFSLRMFHRSFGLMLLQSNIDAPCTLLDFPDLDRFVQQRVPPDDENASGDDDQQDRPPEGWPVEAGKLDRQAGGDVGHAGEDGEHRAKGQHQVQCESPPSLATVALE